MLKTNRVVAYVAGAIGFGAIAGVVGDRVQQKQRAKRRAVRKAEILKNVTKKQKKVIEEAIGNGKVVELNRNEA